MFNVNLFLTQKKNDLHSELFNLATLKRFSLYEKALHVKGELKFINQKIQVISNKNKESAASSKRSLLNI